MAADAFGQLLRTLRLRLGTSQNALARRAAVDPAYINRLERAPTTSTSLPSRRVVLALASSLEASRTNTERLLVAAGLCPDSIVRLGSWEPCLGDLADVLSDPAVSPDDRAELRELLRIVLARWRRVTT